MPYYAPMADTQNDRTLARRLPGGMALYGVALAVGVLVAPPLIWLTGRALFGAYANGGPFSLYGDFFGELLRGSRSAWIVALAPCALVGLIKGAAALSRRLG